MVKGRQVCRVIYHDIAIKRLATAQPAISIIVTQRLNNTITSLLLTYYIKNTLTPHLYINTELLHTFPTNIVGQVHIPTWLPVCAMYRQHNMMKRQTHTRYNSFLQFSVGLAVLISRLQSIPIMVPYLEECTTLLGKFWLVRCGGSLHSPHELHYVLYGDSIMPLLLCDVTVIGDPGPSVHAFYCSIMGEYSWLKINVLCTWYASTNYHKQFVELVLLPTMLI